jgi:hypothetical protein
MEPYKTVEGSITIHWHHAPSSDGERDLLPGLFRSTHPIQALSFSLDTDSGSHPTRIRLAPASHLSCTPRLNQLPTTAAILAAQTIRGLAAGPPLVAPINHSLTQSLGFQQRSFPLRSRDPSRVRSRLP